MDKTERETVFEKIQEVAPSYIAKYMKGIADGKRHKDFDLDTAKTLIKWHYDIAELAMPEVIVVENPKELLQHFRSKPFENSLLFKRELEKKTKPFLQEKIQDEMFNHHEKKPEKILMSVFSHIHQPIDKMLSTLWRMTAIMLAPKDNLFIESRILTASSLVIPMMAYKAFDIEVLGRETKIAKRFYLFSEIYKNSGVYSAIFSEKKVVVCKYPKKIFFTDKGDPENKKGVFVIWGNSKDEQKFECHYLTPEAPYYFMKIKEGRSA